jgi:hypothetical protein
VVECGWAEVVADFSGFDLVRMRVNLAAISGPYSWMARLIWGAQGNAVVWRK